MKRVLVTSGIVALCLAPLYADVTVVQTMSIEGAMAGPGGKPPMGMTLRIKGMKGVSEMEQKRTIIDLDAKQVTILDTAQKTAQIVTLDRPAAATAPAPDIDIDYKATGESRTIDGLSCDEHQFSLSMGLADMGAPGQLPPETAAMMKDVKLAARGSAWSAKGAPGAAEFIAFQKAAASGKVLLALMGGPAGGRAGAGMEKLMSAVAAAPGVPCVTEITLTADGTGPMAQAMKQMGPMKMVMKTTSVSTDPIPDDMFTIPADYTVEKK